MLQVVPIECWSNETLIRLTLDQYMLTYPRHEDTSVQIERQKCLNRNIKELLRRLNKDHIG